MILAFLILSFKPAFSFSSFTLIGCSVVPLRFLPLTWYHSHIWGCWYFSQQSWFQPLGLMQSNILHDMLCIQVKSAAKSLQSCQTLCDPIWQPTRLPVPGILQARHWSGLSFPSPMHESEKWKWSHSGWQYSVLTDSFTNFEPIYFSLSASNCCFLNCIQVSQKTGNVVLICPSPKEFSTLLWSTQFGEINESDVFLEFPCYLYVPPNVPNLISGSSAFSKARLNIWKF